MREIWFMDDGTVEAQVKISKELHFFCITNERQSVWFAHWEWNTEYIS